MNKNGNSQAQKSIAPVSIIDSFRATYMEWRRLLAVEGKDESKMIRILISDYVKKNKGKKR